MCLDSLDTLSVQFNKQNAAWVGKSKRYDHAVYL